MPLPDRSREIAEAKALADLAGAAGQSREIDRAPTGAILPVQSAAPAPSSTLQLSEAAASPKPAIALEPELPPEVRDPPIIEPPQAARPLASLKEEQAAQSAAPTSASAAATGHDVLVALSAMDGRPLSARPLGAGDWRAAREAVRVFYAGRSYAPAWTTESGLNPAAEKALGRLALAGEDGLDFPALALPPAAMPNPTPALLAQADVALTQAIIAYAVEASGGRVDPAHISGDISERPAVADPVHAIERVLAASDPSTELQSFNPPQRPYRELRDKLAQIRASNPELGAALFPMGPTLKIGMIDPRVALIRTRFGLDQDASTASSDALRYDERVASAVANFQRANGLKGNGILNAGTALALAGGDAARQESIVLANMEMWRWEPRDMGEERVEVNVPDFTLKLMQGEEMIHSARVIVGKPDTQTPIFSNAIRYILVNPSWHVPESIVKKEMMPKLAKDHDYLTRMGFEVVQKGDSLLVRQPPGERNALGRILFMFPNDHAVYLHDTPSRGLFGTPRRAYSHGCIRVDQPLQLGEIVMGGQANGWSQQRLRSLVGGSEQTIFLPRRIAIHIEYFTAFVDDSGDLQMREDIYGHMRRVQDALGLLSQG
jgi:L,D-transpeptidase YcbB